MRKNVQSPLSHFLQVIYEVIERYRPQEKSLS